jgi:hypothetical protein
VPYDPAKHGEWVGGEDWLVEDEGEEKADARDGE